MLRPKGLGSLGGGTTSPRSPQGRVAAPAGPRPALFSALGWQGPLAVPKPSPLSSGAANLTGGPRVVTTNPGGVPQPLNSLGVRARGQQTIRLCSPSPVQTGSPSSRLCPPGTTFTLGPSPPLTSRGSGVLTPGRSWTP